MQYEKPFANITYVRGWVDLGIKRISVSFIAHTRYLEVRHRRTKKPLMALFWTNIQDISHELVDGSHIAGIFNDLPVLFDERPRINQESALVITYADMDNQLLQYPTFAIGRQQARFDRLANRIWQHRNQFVRDYKNKE